MISKRKYVIAWIEGDFADNKQITIEEIINAKDDDMEYIYAIGEYLDEVLDLKIGGRLAIKFNRDNEDSDGWIKRIK